jgi:hypothetical protein
MFFKTPFDPTCTHTAAGAPLSPQAPPHIVIATRLLGVSHVFNTPNTGAC